MAWSTLLLWKKESPNSISDYTQPLTPCPIREWRITSGKVPSHTCPVGCLVQGCLKVWEPAYMHLIRCPVCRDTFGLWCSHNRNLNPCQREPSSSYFSTCLFVHFFSIFFFLGGGGADWNIFYFSNSPPPFFTRKRRIIKKWTCSLLNQCPFISPQAFSPLWVERCRCKIFHEKIVR